jgi:hypothetical protein
MALEWKDGGSEPLMWSTDGAKTWCAVWPQGDRFAAWVSGPAGRQTSTHDTETLARAWCAAQMPEDAADG